MKIWLVKTCDNLEMNETACAVAFSQNFPHL